MEKDELLFRVRMGIEGHEYSVYTSGRAEGFGEGALIFNHYPNILRTAIQDSGSNGIPSAPACETKMPTSERLGAGHSAPE